MRRDGRRLVYATGYAHALAMARGDLHAMSVSHQREMAELNREVEKLRREVGELRRLTGVHDPSQLLQ